MNQLSKTNFSSKSIYYDTRDDVNNYEVIQDSKSEVLSDSDAIKTIREYPVEIKNKEDSDLVRLVFDIK